MSTTLRTLCLGLLLTLSSMAGCTSNPNENDDTEPVYTWGNNTTLFIYEHVEQDVHHVAVQETVGDELPWEEIAVRRPGRP